jgi:hypothetical protein
MQRGEAKLGLRFDPQHANDFEVPARLDGVVQERGFAASRLADKHQHGAAALPCQLKDAVDPTALQLTVQQSSLARWRRLGRTNACICPLFARHSRFTLRMCAGRHIHQPIVGRYNDTPVSVPARLPKSLRSSPLWEA